MLPPVDSAPYPWPFDGSWHPADTALLLIDFQTYWCTGGDEYPGPLNDEVRVRAVQALTLARSAGIAVIHTRRGARPDLSDVPANRRWRMARAPGQAIPIRGSGSWQIVPDLTPRDDEAVVDRAGFNAFYASDLDTLLLNRGIRNIMLAGIETEAAVHATMREANDRGFECLLLTDATASRDENAHAAILRITQFGNGLFGTVAPVAALDAALADFQSHAATG